jgi:hypothetical protein
MAIFTGLAEFPELPKRMQDLCENGIAAGDFLDGTGVVFADCVITDNQ